MGQEQGLHRACLLAVRRLPDAIKQLTCLHMFNRQDGESADATGFLHIFATQQEEVAARGGARTEVEFDTGIRARFTKRKT